MPTPVPVGMSTSASKAFCDPAPIGPTANTDRTGATGTLYTIKEAGTYGSYLTGVRLIATATTVANAVRWYLVLTDASIHLLDETLITVAAPSTSLAGFSTVWNPPAISGGTGFGQQAAILIPAGATLKAGIEITPGADTPIVATAEGWDL